MKAIFSILLLWLVQLNVAGGQALPATLPLANKNGGATITSYSLQSRQRLMKKLGLADVSNSKLGFRLRFWTSSQVVDIWEKDAGAYSGMVTNYAQRYDARLYRHHKLVVDSVFFNKLLLDSLDARRLAQLTERLRITSIPTFEQVPGWPDGLDGVLYDIETSIGSHYSFKTYWSPQSFADSIPEAKAVAELVEGIYQVLKSKPAYQRLRLPIGDYQHDGAAGILIQTPPADNIPALSIYDLF